jgi:hypothetical protein
MILMQTMLTSIKHEISLFFFFGGGGGGGVGEYPCAIMSSPQGIIISLRMDLKEKLKLAPISLGHL